MSPAFPRWGFLLASWVPENLETDDNVYINPDGEAHVEGEHE